MTAGKGRIGYTLTHYPSISNTFIRNEIAAVERAGLEVIPMPVRPTKPDQILSRADEEAHAKARPVLPLGLSDLVRCLVLPAVRHPGAFVSTLRLALRTGGTDLREIVWRCFWFIEAMKVWRTCRDEGITHLHAHFASVSANMAWFAVEFANRSGDTGPRSWTWSFTMHGYHEFIEQKAHTIDRKVASASVVICIADYIRSQMMRLSDPEHWGKLTVVTCGIDTESFAFEPPPEHRDDRPFTLLHVGRLAEEKGQTLLVDAVADLRKRGHDVVLDIIGRGPLEPAIHERIARHGVADAVTLHGARGHDEILDWYHRSDAFVMSSFVEGVPVVLMEAMAAGTPVIAPWITGIPELVDDGVEGLLVRPARADALADAVERLVEDQTLARRLAVAAREKVESSFERDASGRLVAEILEAASHDRLDEAILTEVTAGTLTVGDAHDGATRPIPRDDSA